MYVHEGAGLCFLAHPRTASRAVRDALAGIGFEAKGAHHDGPDQGYDLSPYQVVFGVRNHWDALVSWWFNARMFKKEKIPSLGWLAIHLSQNQYYFRPGTLWWFLDQIPDATYFHFENMQVELNVILMAHGLPAVEIPKVGMSEERAGRHYREFYDSNTRHFVGWLFKPEIMRLGYSFNNGTGANCVRP